MATRTFSRRQVLRGLGFAAAGSVLAACAQPTPQVVEKVVTQEVEKVVEKPVEKLVTQQVEKVVTQQVEKVVTAVPAAKVNIRLAEGSWVGPEGIKYWTDDIIQRFQLENPNITVTFESAESNDYADKLYTQAVAGDAPDVFFIWWSAGLMEQGQLLQLDEYFDKDYLADFYPANIVGQQLNGHLYGVPKYVSTTAMAYNKKILDEAGVKYPDENWTWDNYLDAFNKCTKRDKDGKITQWGTYVPHNYLPHWVWAGGGEWMEGDLFGTKCLLDQPKAVAALKWLWDQIYGKQPVAPKIGSIADKDNFSVFSTGKVAFVDSHSWTVTNYMRECDFQWDFVLLPKGPSGKRAGLTFVNGYSAPAKTKHPAEAIQLMRFLTSPWAGEAGLKSIVGLQPVRKSLKEAWDTLSLGGQAGYNVAAFSTIMDDARLIPMFKDDKQILDEIFNPIWDKIWVTGDMQLEEGLTEIAKRINER
jgi:multiple sugar transport system substrate-binding protein